MEARHLAESTRSAMRLFGFLLAKDLQQIGPDVVWAPDAKAVLNDLDKLDVHGDEDADWQLESTIKASGPEWLALAEEGGFFEGTDYIGNVLYHFDAGGYPGGGFVRLLLQTIDAADDGNRWSLSAGHPEYVGLWRACAQVEGGIIRLMAVMDRKS